MRKCKGQSVDLEAWRGLFYSHVGQLFSKVLTKNRVAISQQVTRELLERECVAQLLGGPVGGRVRGHVEVGDDHEPVPERRDVTKSTGQSKFCMEAAYLSGRKSALYGRRPCELLCVHDRQTAES
jgi:hypothetical protein